MKTKPIPGIAIAASALLIVSGCTSSPEPAPTQAPGGEYYLDPAAEQISEEAAQRITELYEAALANGESEVNLISNLAEDMASTWEAFEEMFPGIRITYASLIGAPLMTQLQTEAQSGNHVTDILHNPNGQLYVDFAQPYEVVGLEVPEQLASSATEIVHPEHLYSSPFIGYFGLGVFLPRAGELDPRHWADFTAPEYDGLIGMGDPTLPGPSQDAPIYLTEIGALDDDQLREIFAQSVIKGTYGEAIAALMQGEYAFLFAAPVGAVANAAKAGAPVEVRLMAEHNYVVPFKHLLLENAPNPNAAKLYLEFLNTFTAQQRIAESNMVPLNPNAVIPDAPWTSLEAGNVVEIVPAADIDARRADVLPWLDGLLP